MPDKLATRRMRQCRASRNRTRQTGRDVRSHAAFAVSAQEACSIFGVRETVVRERRNGQRWSQNKETLARHITMYLAHIVFGVRLCDVAAAAEVRAPSALKAIRKIEDMRDDPDFDLMLEGIEARIRPQPMEIAA
jgi:hypothetical protein